MRKFSRDDMIICQFKDWREYRTIEVVHATPSRNHYYLCNGVDEWTHECSEFDNMMDDLYNYFVINKDKDYENCVRVESR